MTVRILITGSRSWYCQSIARDTLTAIRARIGDGFVAVHGDCATGVDRAFRDQCEVMGVRDERHPAKWDAVDRADSNAVHHWTGRAYDANAGPRRNTEMVSLGAAYCIAVHQSIARSRGTRDCAAKCRRAGIAVYLLDGKGPARRLRAEDLEVER